MNCLECQDLLQKRLDGALAKSPALDQHLAGCVSCRQSHAAATLLLDGARTLPRSTLPAHFTDRMVAAVLHDRVVRQRRTVVRWRVIAAMAAALLLFAFTGHLWLPQQKQDAPKQLVVETHPPTPVPEERPLAQSVDEARDAVVALTDRLAAETKDQARWLMAAAPQDVPMATLPSLDAPLDPAAKSFRQAGQGFSQALTTVTKSARRAVDYFVRELPDLEPSANN